MEKKRSFYRRNLLLISVFLLLITGTLAGALILTYDLTKKYVENEFSSKKIEVLEETMRSYNDFFKNKIPEISFYQGFLDSASAVKYTDTVLAKFPFVRRVVFYDLEISNHPISEGLRADNFSMSPKAVYQFGRNIPPSGQLLYKSGVSSELAVSVAAEFNKIAVKFSSLIGSLDTTKAISSELFNVFYSISANTITYMNIPRREEMRTFKELMLKKLPPSPVYEQDVMTFYMNPLQLRIKNIHPELYQQVSIKPLVYESIDTNPDIINTDIPLSGAFADYKLFFISTKQFLNKEIIRRFMPIAGALLLLYLVLGIIAFLIYKNLNINRKMFKLQYDFINNLTHEFKTPVSVIKIAGNNIRSAKELSDAERMNYGKILDEEADKLNDLMTKLLSFTQIENRAIRIKSEQIDLPDFVKNIINAYQLKYPSLKINYEIKKVEFFKTDPVMLTSIFQNLIDNAFKYSLPERRLLHISIKRHKASIIFQFKDQGIGIPKTEIGNIFKKFYRVQNQFNQQGSAGLGLAFCKELINFMNGSISVKSRPGAGSEFTVILPYIV